MRSIVHGRLPFLEVVADLRMVPRFRLLTPASLFLAGTIMLEGINAACLRSVFPFTASMLLRV